MPTYRAEYDPDEQPYISPDEDPDETPAPPSGSPVHQMGAGHGVSGQPEREWEFRTENLTLDALLDGASLAAAMTAAGADNWQLVDVVDAGEQRVLLFRRAKSAERPRRALGFTPPVRA